jgi:hypothetical protein
LQGEEKYCTEGFKEIGLIYGATEESYRKTSALLNRIRHQGGRCGIRVKNYTYPLLLTS